MRFLGIVAAVFVANLITLVFIAIAFALLISDQGQAFLRHLGYDISPLVSAYQQARIKEWKDPGVGRMTPIEITPSPEEPELAQPKPAPKTSGNKPDRHAIQTTLNTCRFWNNEYLKDGTDRSKGFRDAACRRYERLSGIDVDQDVSLATTPQSLATTQHSSAMQLQQASDDDPQHESYCKTLQEKIDYHDAKLRSGGDGSYMTYWRGERRNVSNKYSWECLRK